MPECHRDLSGSEQDWSLLGKRVRSEYQDMPTECELSPLICQSPDDLITVPSPFQVTASVKQRPVHLPTMQSTSLRTASQHYGTPAHREEMLLARQYTALAGTAYQQGWSATRWDHNPEQHMMECPDWEALGIVRHAQKSVEAALEAAAAAAEGLGTHHTSASQQDAACRITGSGN